MILGVEPVDRELWESHETVQGHWVYFMAHIQSHVEPAYVREAIVHIHARAIWKLMCPNKLEQPHTILISPHDESNWMRVMFRRRIEGELYDHKKFLHNEAKNLKHIWQLVRYAESGYTNENKMFSTSKLGRECPIQPCHIRIEDGVRLGLGIPEAEKTAHLILTLARVMSSWGPRTADLLVLGLKMKRSEILNGLNYLIENDFLASEPDEVGYIIREKFVVHCWRAFLHS
jgi:hypothetical protein